jgi:hypothetical protein
MHVMSPQRAILEVLHPSHVPGHPMYGDWALPGREFSYIALGDLVARHLPGKLPACVQFADICAKPGDWLGGNDFSGPRFTNADPRFPGFLVRAMPNPCRLPYRLIDGRRRLEKLRRAGATAADFYVFEYAEVEPFIFDFALKGGN